MEQGTLVLTKQIVQQWADALRSGKYKQTRLVTRVEANDGSCKHCVMGVLIDLLAPDKWEAYCRSSEGMVFKNSVYPSVFQLKDHNPMSLHNIVYYNDTAGLTFEQLADYLEDHLHDFEECDPSDDGVLSETDEDISTQED